MPHRLRLDKIEQKAKKVFYVKSWRDAAGISKRPELLQEFLKIVRCIQSGTPLPDYCYRKNIDTTSDQLLLDDGVMHLHLGSKNSNELVFLVQYPSYVYLLEVSDHYHFKRDPPGSYLRLLHEKALAEAVKEFIVERKRQVSAGLLKPRQRTNDDPANSTE